VQVLIFDVCVSKKVGLPGGKFTESMMMVCARGVGGGPSVACGELREEDGVLNIDNVNGVSSYPNGV
jgi:hypothetical protein